MVPHITRWSLGLLPRPGARLHRGQRGRRGVNELKRSREMCFSFKKMESLACRSCWWRATLTELRFVYIQELRVPAAQRVRAETQAQDVQLEEEANPRSVANCGCEYDPRLQLHVTGSIPPRRHNVLPPTHGACAARLQLEVWRQPSRALSHEINNHHHNNHYSNNNNNSTFRNNVTKCFTQLKRDQT